MPRRVVQEFRGAYKLTSKLAIPPDGLGEAENVGFFRGGDGRVKVQGRNGRSLLATVSADDTIVGLHRHYEAGGTIPKSTIVAYDDGSNALFKHATNDSTTYAAPSGAPTLTKDTSFNFANFPGTDITYITNGVDAPYSYDVNAGTVMAAWTPTNLTPRGRAITVWANRVWCAHSDNILYATNNGNPGVITTTEALAFDSARGGEILNVFGYGDVLITITDTGCFRFTGQISASTIDSSDFLEYSTVGGVGERSACLTDYGVAYGARDGIYLTNGFGANVNIAAPIMELWPAAGYPDMVVRWDPAEQQLRVRLQATDDYCWVATRVDLRLGTSPSSRPILRAGSSISPTQFYVKAVTNKNIVWAWAKHLNTPMADGTAYPGAVDSGQFISGDTAGKLWLQNDGLLDDETDVIPLIETAPIPVSDRYQENGLVDVVRITYKGRHSCIATINMDNRGVRHPTIPVPIGETSDDDDRIVDGWIRMWDMSNKGVRTDVEIRLPRRGKEAELHSILIDTLAVIGDSAERSA